jgi:hypothetical protein
MGTAAASLSPSLGTKQSAKDASSNKMSEILDPENAGALPVSPPKRGENRPPVSSLEDQFKHLTVDVAGPRNLTSTFNM